MDNTQQTQLYFIERKSLILENKMTIISLLK